MSCMVFIGYTGTWRAGSGFCCVSFGRPQVWGCNEISKRAGTPVRKTLNRNPINPTILIPKPETEISRLLNPITLIIFRKTELPSLGLS